MTKLVKTTVLPPARVELTLRLSLEDLQLRVDTLTLQEWDGILSLAKTTQAPCTASDTISSPPSTGGEPSMPPASEAVMKVILDESKRCSTGFAVQCF